MAHFIAPDRRRDGYDVDGKLAPDSVWRMRVLTGQRREIGLWGGQELEVRSNNSNVVPNDGFLETSSRADGLRMLSLLGKSPGISMLETRLKGNLWCTLQVVVADADLTASPPRDDRHLALLAPEWGLQGVFGPVSGSVPAAFGVATVARIPVPGSNLVVQLNSRGWKGSTSTIFIWEKSGGRYANTRAWNMGTPRRQRRWLITGTGRGRRRTFGEFRITPPSAKAAKHCSRPANT